MTTITTTTKRPPMTAAAAKAFDRYSFANATTAEAVLAKSVCQNGCRAYHDIYTYNRWQALGFQVQKGQHGARIPVIVHVDRDTEDPQTLRRVSTVFCRCQVKEVVR